MARNMVRLAALAIAVVAVTVSGTAVAAAAVRADITSVTFSGLNGEGQPSPTITVHGLHFGTAPAGVNNNVTSCGPYANNGKVFKNQLYFVDSGNFEAGYSNSSGANCMGIILRQWTQTRAVFKFGSSYSSFAHWYLSNGDGFAVSMKTAIWGGSVTGLT